MKRSFLIIFFLIGILSLANAQNQNIDYFIVKENLLKNEKLAIIATDSLEIPLERINGVFNFSVNGFKQELNFHDGVAVCPLQIEKSAFVFFKHLNDSGSHSNLYFIYKKNNDLNPIKISWYLLLAVPLGLVLIGYMFRKLIGFVIFILLILGYFYYSKGLSIPTFFESVFDGVKNIF
ncbi:hypothetical protein A5893_08950 [Pedobacter psychrophilus]|uniref:Uncharacterized protein n=1 Tax=Pedobacter psychrophilus TaxID=1826909 RepID=A0A179DF99_9SPHI|nr:hypothetical protein [Pedobacter psychrophilus]OAQ39701.1 hypothetical protein A5893_08950 [Pedobacter psychrophilus]